MQEQVSGGLRALPPCGSGGEKGDKWGEPLPLRPLFPPMKKQEARPPSNFQPPPRCPACPRGVGHRSSAGPCGGAMARSGGGLSLLSSQLAPIVGPRRRTRDAGDGKGPGLSAPPPLPHRVPCSPRGGGRRGPAARAAGLGEGREGKREGRPGSPPRGPSATCPPPPPTAAPPAPRAAPEQL